MNKDSSELSAQIARLQALRQKAVNDRNQPPSSSISTLRELKSITRSRSSNSSIASNEVKSEVAPKTVSYIQPEVEDNGPYIATLQLLVEQLQEQGKLRALLEYTTSPQKLNEELRLLSPSVDTGLKIRALTLQIEELVQHTVAVRAQMTKERDLRVKAETALEILRSQYSELESELITARRTSTSSSFNTMSKFALKRDHQRPQSLYRKPIQEVQDFESPVQDKKKTHLHATPPPPPPPPLSPEDIDSDELTISVHDITLETTILDDLQSSSSLGQVGQRSRLETERPAVSLHDSSPSPSKMTLDIDVGGGKTCKLEVDSSMDPIELAYSFLQQNSLPPGYLEPLAAYIITTQQTLNDSRQQGLNNTVNEPSPPKIPPTASHSSLLSNQNEIWATRDQTNLVVSPVKSVAIDASDRHDLVIEGMNTAERVESYVKENLQPDAYSPTFKTSELSPSRSKERSSVEQLEMAVELYDRATALANDGAVVSAVPLYRQALEIFEALDVAGIDNIREEVAFWMQKCAS